MIGPVIQALASAIDEEVLDAEFFRLAVDLGNFDLLSTTGAVLSGVAGMVADEVAQRHHSRLPRTFCLALSSADLLAVSVRFGSAVRVKGVEGKVGS